MGDRTDYQITIGGKMTAETLDGLIEEIEAEGLGMEWESIDTDELREAFRLADGKWPLTLTAHDVNYGNCDEVEKFCRANGLPYVREWDSGGGYGPGMEVFDGDGSRSYDTAGIGRGGALMSRSDFDGIAEGASLADWFEAAAFKPPPVVIEGDA